MQACSTVAPTPCAGRALGGVPDVYVSEILADIRRDDLRAGAVIQRLRALLVEKAVGRRPFDLIQAAIDAATVLHGETRRRRTTHEIRSAIAVARLNKQIADELGISERTVKMQRARSWRSWGLARRSSWAGWANGCGNWPIEQGPPWSAVDGRRPGEPKPPPRRALDQPIEEGAGPQARQPGDAHAGQIEPGVLGAEPGDQPPDHQADREVD
jgi:DNA-binding CsgD family transcriptional regulator